MTRFSATLAALLLLTGLVAACDRNKTPDPWTQDEMETYLEVMENAGTAFAVHDICMPMIEEDPEVRAEVVAEVEAKRFADLLEFDTAKEYQKLIEALKEKGGTEEQIALLEEAYSDAYAAADAEIKTIYQCQDTLINYHNTILNTGVREYP